MIGSRIRPVPLLMLVWDCNSEHALEPSAIEAMESRSAHERLRLTLSRFSRMAISIRLNQWLPPVPASKEPVRAKIVALLGKGGAVPSFSEAALKLCHLAQDEDASLEDFAAVVSTDAGLATRCLEVASSVRFAARPIHSIIQALSLIGVEQMRRIAFTLGTIDTFAEFKHGMDWKRFWLHNLLVARLAERVVGAFRKPTGMEYLAGLLHDVGKLVIEHYFPEQFETIVSTVAESCSDPLEIERDVLGLDHTQIGAAVCDCLRINEHILQAVKFHHDPLNNAHLEDPSSDGGFLAASVAVANRFAHSRSRFLPVGYEFSDIFNSAEWMFLTKLAEPAQLEICLDEEIERAELDLSAFT